MQLAGLLIFHCGLFKCKILAAVQDFVMNGTYEMDWHDYHRSLCGCVCLLVSVGEFCIDWAAAALSLIPFHTGQE